MLGTLARTKIEQLLNTQVIGRIGCHHNGITYVVPISYAYDGEYIYAHSGEGMKMEMMRNNPKVCFEVDNLQNMANWESVIAMGDFEELKDSKERAVAFDKLMSRTHPIISSQTVKLTSSWPFHSSDLNDIPGIFFRIHLTEKSGRFEKFEKTSEFAS